MTQSQVVARLRREVRRGAIAGLTAGLALTLANCGGSEDEARNLAGVTVVKGVGPLREVIISERDLSKVPANSPRRTFLGYRHYLQFQAWGKALEYLQPEFVAFVGETRLVAAFQAEATHFRSVRPAIQWVERGRREATVGYVSADASGAPSLHSVQLRRSDGKWVITYDSFLDGALATSEQNAAQTQVNPLATRPGRVPLQAGAAARKLQSEFLQQQRADREDAGDVPGP